MCYKSLFVKFSGPKLFVFVIYMGYTVSMDLSHVI